MKFCPPKGSWRYQHFLNDRVTEKFKIEGLLDFTNNNQYTPEACMQLFHDHICLFNIFKTQKIKQKVSIDQIRISYFSEISTSFYHKA